MRHVRIGEDTSLEEFTLGELGFRKGLRKKLRKFSPAHRLHKFVKKHSPLMKRFRRKDKERPEYEPPEVEEPEEVEYEEYDEDEAYVPPVPGAPPSMPPPGAPVTPTTHAAPLPAPEPWVEPPPEPEEPIPEVIPTQTVVKDQPLPGAPGAPALPAAPTAEMPPGPVEEKPEDEEGAPAAFLMEEGGFPWLWVGIGAGVLVAGALVYFLVIKKKPAAGRAAKTVKK